LPCDCHNGPLTEARFVQIANVGSAFVMFRAETTLSAASNIVVSNILGQSSHAMPTATPQPILDALAQVQADAESEAASVAEEVSAAAVTATGSQKRAGVAATLALIASTYGA
jgi:hypothetical protein